MSQAHNLDSGDLKISSKIKFPNLRSLFTNVGKQLGELLGSHHIGIYLRGRESGNWALALSRGLDESTEEAIRILNQDSSAELKKAIQTRQPCLLEEVLPNAALDGMTGYSFIIAPMAFEDEVMGLLLADFDAFASLSEKDLIQLSLAALMFKVAIEKEFLVLKVAKLESDIQKNSPQDPQNFLYNEGILNWFLEIEIERGVRHGTRFAVISIGIDNLVGIITQFGQNAANTVISQCMDSFNRIVRKCDFLTRRDGERFICVSMEQNEAGAMVLAEKFRHRAKETNPIVEGKPVAITISIGMALWPDGTKISAPELIMRAEQAMKLAQEKGNRVRLWKQDMTSGAS